MNKALTGLRLKTFRGYLPPKQILPQLISPPYDVLSTAEARNLAAGNSKSWLRVTRPDLELTCQPYSSEIYTRAKENLKTFLKQKYIVPDIASRVYLYGQKMGNHTQYGIIALSSVEDYDLGRIKKHELTRKAKELDRTKITEAQNAHTEPVFLTYKHSSSIDRTVSEIISTQEPYADLHTDDSVRHMLWLVNEKVSEQIVGEFSTIDCAYIADGHHRAASAYNVAKMHEKESDNPGSPYKYFMSILYPDNNLMVLDYNRVLKSLCGLSVETVLEKLKKSYEVSLVKGDPKPTQKGVHGMYLNKNWYTLKIKNGLVNWSDPIGSLDVSILTEFVLKRIFGITNLRTDSRIDFIGGIRGLKEIEKRCSEDCVCGFSMYPVTIQEIMRVSDKGLIMPPKSTWFEPKPRSGLVVNLMDEL